MNIWKQFILPILLSIIVCFIGLWGYTYIAGFSMLQAFYMIVVTITTVGYRPVKEMSEAGLVFDAIFVLTAVIVGVFVASKAIIFISDGHMRNLRRRKKMDKRIAQLKDHYIICGFGRVGHQIAAEFEAQKEPYVIIDAKPETQPELEEKNILFVIGAVSSDEVLEKAGIKNAKGLIAAADSDTENVYVTLAARVLNPNIYIVARSAHSETESKLKKAGANKVISPYMIAGRRMASTVLRPVAVDFLDIAMHSENIELWMDELEIKENSGLLNKSILETKVREGCGAQILAVKKKSGHFDLNPCTDTKIELGDIVIALGTNEQLKLLENMVK